MERREILKERIEAFISRFERAGTQPDLWQNLWLIRALTSLQGGNYLDGENELRRAEISPELRSSHDVQSSTRYSLLTTAQHRVNFERIKIQSRR
jgi:hypothetical protein